MLPLTAGGGLISVGVDRVGRLLGHDEARCGAGVPQGGRGHAGRHTGRPPGSDRGETIRDQQKITALKRDIDDKAKPGRNDGCKNSRSVRKTCFGNWNVPTLFYRREDVYGQL